MLRAVGVRSRPRPVIVVTGAAGQLGTALRQILGDGARYLTSADVDLTDSGAIRRHLGRMRPSVLINCAAFNAVDRAESQPEIAVAVNTTAVRAMAEVAADSGGRFATFSTDYVFDGALERPYVESDATGPLNVYGAAKRAGEVAALAATAENLVIRTSWLMSGAHHSFASTMISRARAGDVSVVDDQRGHPTLAPDLATATMAALDRNATGILHLANSGVVSRYELACEIVELAGIDPARVRPCTTVEFGAPARRPLNGVINSERLSDLGLEQLPHYRSGLERAVAELVTWLP